MMAEWREAELAMWRNVKGGRGILLLVLVLYRIVLKNGNGEDITGSIKDYC